MLADLTQAVEARHPWTMGHAHRVAGLAVRAAKALGWSDEALGNVRAGSLLHDVGKLTVPAAVLAKSGPLTASELAEVRRHPAAGAVLVSALPGARRALPSILHHHEHWDGTGYPGRMSGEAIPAEARLVWVWVDPDEGGAPRGAGVRCPPATASRADSRIERAAACLRSSLCLSRA